MTLRARLMLAPLVALISVAWLVPTSDAATKVKFSSSYAVDTPFDMFANRFAQLVKERTNGEIEITVFPNAQLGSEVETAEGIRLGTIEAGVVTTSKLVEWVPDLGVVDLPFMFDNDDHVARSYPVLMDKMSPKLAAAGFRLVAMPLAGVRHLISTFPIEKPEDVKGKRMRVLPNPLHIRMWQLVGANPTPIEAPEVYNALQTHVIDFMDNPKNTYLSFRWYEVAKYFVQLGHVVSFHAIVFSESWWQKLPPEQQKVIFQSAQDLVPFLHHLGLYEDDRALAKTVAAGSKVSTVKDKEVWRKLMAPVWDDFKTHDPNGASLIDAIRAAAPAP